MNLAYQRFETQPESLASCTKVVATHPYHGTYIYYLPLDDFQDNIKGLLTPFWVNEFTVLMTPC